MESLIGKKIGFWTVRGIVNNGSAPTKTYLDVECICGKRKKVVFKDLRNSVSLSCGCLRQQSICEKNTRFNTYDLKNYDYGICFMDDELSFIFDKEDFDKICDYHWTVEPERKGPMSYKNKKRHYPKYLVLDRTTTEPGISIDFANEDVFDCRKSNLVLNYYKKHNTVQQRWTKIYFPRISPIKKKYDSYLQIKERQFYLGRFDNKKQAEEIVDIAVKMHKDYGMFPD